MLNIICLINVYMIFTKICLNNPAVPEKYSKRLENFYFSILIDSIKNYTEIRLNNDNFLFIYYRRLYNS